MRIDRHGFHGILHSANLIETVLRRQLAPIGISPSQARVLEAMDRMGSVCQSDLASEFGITPASMSTMADRLLSAGYITRTVDPASRRQNVLELTDTGRTLVGGIYEAWTVVDDTIRAALGKDATQFFELGRRLREGLGGAIPGSRSNHVRCADRVDPATSRASS